MARLVHVTTGAVVEVDDSKVERLGSEWKAADKKSAPRTRSTKKSDSE